MILGEANAPCRLLSRIMVTDDQSKRQRRALRSGGRCDTCFDSHGLARLLPAGRAGDLLDWAG